jgi:AAA15 family ATPase/GTPase
MSSSPDTSYEDALISFDDKKYVKQAVVLGPNGSGKSNFINAIFAMKNMVLFNYMYYEKKGFPFAPFISQVDKPTELGIQFEKNGIRYNYGFSYNQTSIISEYLYIYPNGRETKVFKKDGAEFSCNQKYESVFKHVRSWCNDNMLILPSANNICDISFIHETYKFFDEDLLSYHFDGYDEISNSNLIKLKDENVKKRLLSFLDTIDSGIVDYQLPDTNLKYVSNYDFMNVDDIVKTDVSREKNLVELRKCLVLDYGNQKIPFSLASSGIHKIIDFFCFAVDAIDNGKVIIADEFESHMHPLVARQLLVLFNDKATNKNAQLIFTSNETLLLNLKYLRRDQVWFAEILKDTRATNMYCLSQVRNVRKVENIQKNYVTGKYGAIPCINEKTS